MMDPVAVALITHPSGFGHIPPRGHPERPQRVEAAVKGVEASGRDIMQVTAPRVHRDQLLAVHDATLVDELERFCAAGGGAIDADTYAAAGSFEAAEYAAGAGGGAVDTLRTGAAETAFVVVRPPGHHADEVRAMGFCLFNNVAVTAAGLVAAGDRVAVVDWDVHHGNGTQDIFGSSADVLYVSLHQFPFYPGTGWVDEIGSGLGTGATVNVPLPAGTDGGAYRAAFARLAVPIVQQFGPDWLLVSAGYDAHAADPLAELRLVDADYRWMASRLAALVPPSKTIFFLEGGYNLDAITASVAATIDGALAPGPIPDALGRLSSTAGRTVDYAVDRMAAYWDVS